MDFNLEHHIVILPKTTLVLRGETSFLFVISTVVEKAPIP